MYVRRCPRISAHPARADDTRTNFGPLRVRWTCPETVLADSGRPEKHRIDRGDSHQLRTPVFGMRS